MGTRPQVQVPGEPSHPPGNALVRHLQPGGHGDRPPEGPSYPPGRRTAPEGTGVRSLRARLHDLVDREEDERIIQAAVAQPFINAAAIMTDLGLEVSNTTVRRRLHSAGLHHRVPAMKEHLTDVHRNTR
ncbi:hypothetical protein Pcinc_005062 [Petrolisthes cinctipes]|uniref:Transposase Tc1-like domain-containing protein n=1 Tax=Petrolisthes cinctipes TaxID=88211 RepID=A0AAE1GE71_PETCI|nr:hypothetical protein Pcinc_005062 [Petrolisthes cinctipes]